MISNRLDRLFQLHQAEYEAKQEELAKKVGVDQAAISYYEKDFKTPTLMVAKRICDALEVTVDWLLTGK